MRTIKISALTFITFIFLFTSCDENIKKNGLPRSIGNTSEVLVVLQNDEQWESMIGDTIKHYLGEFQYGLMQAEPIFNLSHITINNFSDMFKKHRNLLIISIDNNATDVTVETSVNKWASPQQIIKMNTPSSRLLADEFHLYYEEIIAGFNKAERERILNVFRPSSRNKVRSSVLKKHNIDITIPQGFYVAKTEPGFMWIRKEVSDYSQGIVIISEPYMDEAQFSQQSIIARSNRDLAQYIPGPTEESYMSLDEEYIPAKRTIINDYPIDYAVEIRGVWIVKQDFMGGPFISYTFTNPDYSEIITLMGYVYHPNKEKRDLLRQLEAILYSVKFREVEKGNTQE